MKSIHTIISRVYAILNGKRNESPTTNQTENVWKKCFSRMAGVLALSLFLGGSVWGQVTETLSGSGTWLVPAGVSSITVKCWGGGGGGGGSTSNSNGGSGGGSGGYSTLTISSLNVGDSFTYSVGTGGSAGLATAATTIAGSGTASTFININLSVNLSAGGGGGGQANKGSVGMAGTSSGGSTNSTGNNGVVGTTSGGSGGSAPNLGGSGGAGLQNGPGTPGSAPGGGGGGGEANSNSKIGGAGGAGQIIITYTSTNHQSFDASTLPTCWSTSIVAIQTASKLSYVTSGSSPTTASYHGTNFIQYNSFSSTNGSIGSEERLISPIYTSGSSASVSFAWRNENSTSYNSGAYLNEGVQLQYSTNGTTWTNAGSFIPRHDGSLASSTAQWNTKFISLPAGALNQTTLYIAFKFHSEYGNNCFMDFIFFGGLSTPQTATPTVSSPIACDATTISGTSTEANGTVVELFSGSTSLGTTTVSSGAWTKSGLTALAGGATITAKATANCKTVSAASSAVTVDACTTPLITLSATSLSAFTSCANSASTTATFTVSGANLGANNLTVTPPSGFEISSDGATSYVNSTTSPAYLTFTPSTGTVSSQTITVRMMAQSSSPTAATISCAATGATTKTVSVSGTVNPLPTATWAANATSVCYSSSAQNTPVAYTATTNTPTSYSITWNSTPTNSFVAVTNQSNTFTSAGAAGTLSIAVPAGATANTYTGTITVKNANSCVSASSNFTVTINALPANPANPNSNTPQCVTSGVTLTANGSAPSGETWYWQTVSTGTITASSASTYTVTTSNTYYIRSQVAATGCWSTGVGSLAVTVNPLPTALVLTGSTVCSGVTTTISSSTSVSGINYQLFNSSNAIVGSTVAGTGSALTWSGTAAGTGYYVIGTDATTTCSSAQSNAVNIVVNALPASPGNPTSNSPQCLASGVTLTANGSAPSGETWYWQTGSTGTITASSASTYSVTVTGTYYIRSRNNTSTCWSSAAGAQGVVVNAEPSISTQPSASTQAVCQNGTLTSLSVSATAGSGTISAYQWYSNTTSSTSGGTSVAGTNSTYTPQSSSAGTLYYYVTITNSNGCSTTSSVSGAVTVSLQMSGTYSVGVGGNYATLTAAVTAINSACMTGPVIFSLTDATYSTSETFPITINANSSASATNTLTIKPASGVTATISGSSAVAIFKLNGADYVTIDGSNNGSTSKNLTISNTNTSTSSAVIWLGSASVSNGATNNTIKNCIVTGNAPTTTFGGIISSSGTTIGSAAEVANSNNAYNNNTLNTVQWGITVVGPTGNESGTVISGNLIGSATAGNKIGLRGISIYQQIGVSVTGNTVFGVTTATSSTASGIYVSGTQSGGTISCNKISDIKNTNTGGYGSNGIGLYSSSTTGNVTVQNNMIYDITGVGDGGAAYLYYNGHGIMLYSGGGYNLYNNTVNMNTNQTGGLSSAIYIRSSLVTAASVNIRNNIFANTQTEGAAAGMRYAIYCAAANTIFGTINHNSYYTSGTHLGSINGSNRTTLSNLKHSTSGFGQNTNSINALPSFTSATDLHLTTSGNCSINNAGTTISGITADYDGDTRSTSTPDIGADEFTGDINTAGTASTTPTLCINTALTNITHATTGATGIGTATSLPAGVSATWASNTITISGTPSASGTFSYTIPLTGGCGSVNATGTITVTAANTAAAASSTPTLCISTALTAITHTTTGATGIGTATGLPAGVSAAWVSNTITISGTPSASGVFGYSIPLTGGCGSVNATGTITVSPPSVAGTIAAASSSVCSGTGTTLTLSGNTGTIEWQSSTDNVTYGTISGATASSLSTGNLTQTKYFKALVSSGTCSAASTSAQVITIYANGTYIGPSTGDWNDAANWCGGLPSNATNAVISSGDVVTLNINAETTVATMTINGSLIVPSTAQLTVIGLLTNNGTFTLKDGATFIQGTSGTSITGNGTFNVEKALANNSSTWTTTSGRFWYMGVPMVNVVRSGYGTTGTTTNRVWSYAESTKSYTELTDNALLSAGTGYVHRRSTDGTITFSAIGADGLYRSDVNMSGLTITTGTSAGYHLVSNPYMAYLDWNSVTKTNIEPTFYIRTNNTTSSNISALISYNSETNFSTNTSSVTATTAQLRYIAPLQSIWVRVGTAAATGSLAMTRGILSHQTGNVGLKSSTVFPTLARVNLVDGNNFDQLLVYLNSDMSNEVDQYDSEKMAASGTVQVYTMSSNKKLVMNGLKNNKKKVSVPLYLELPETKSYTLQLSEYQVEDGLILLEDKQEGTLQDFTLMENYSFYANSGLLQNRFVLHFILPDAELTTQGPSNSWVAEEGSYTEGGDVEISNDDRGNIQISLNQPEDQKVEGTVFVTDMNGKAVYSGQLEGIITAIELDVPSGIYYLTVQSGTLIEKKKVFIQD